ncbi:MAG: hypothetical protein AAF847_11925 [Bacteroidota bacterium]
MYKYFVSVVCMLFCVVCSLNAQSDNKPLENQASLVFGVSQLVIGGYNVEGNLFLQRLALEYSHGVSLNLSNDFLEAGNDKSQYLDIHLPWTTGFGIGYRFNNWLNLRVESKWHKFELYQAGAEEIASNLLLDYTTFTLGLGLYANLKPFKNQDNLLKGLMIVPNFRWWPKVSSSLADDQVSYFNNRTGEQEIHEAREIGIGNTPFFYNFSVGYSIAF